MRNTALLAVLPALLLSTPAMAKEFPIGGPVTHEGMEISAAWLEGISVSPGLSSMVMGKEVIHLESDIHATQGNKWGFSNGEWIPYLTIDYQITRQGDSDFNAFGQLLPMIARDGTHYAHSVKMPGPGVYTVKLKYTPPDEKGFLRHVDKETGVPAWFTPFTETFTFTYPAK